MRTSVEEVKEAARFIAKKINLSSAPVRVLLPEKGVSALDCSGKPFHDEGATAALFQELESCIKQSSDRQVRYLWAITDRSSLFLMKIFLSYLNMRSFEPEIH